MAFYFREQLTKRQILAILRLFHLCENPDQIHALSLCLPEESEPFDDTFYLLYYQDRKLVSFLSCQIFPNERIDISGFTHPNCRGQGLFGELLEEALLYLPEPRKEPVYYQADGSNPASVSFLNRHGASYQYSECMMEQSLGILCGSFADLGAKQTYCLLSECTKEEAGKAHGTLIDLHKACFPKEAPMAEGFIRTVLEDPDTRTFLIQNRKSETIGLLQLTDGMAKKAPISYLFGFGILPEHRRNGYGMCALKELTALLAKEKGEDSIFALQVSTANLPACTLYRRIGMEVSCSLDYFL